MGILAACLAAAAFAAPIDNFVDPDCIEEDLVVEEPSQEIDADFALGVPDLVLNFSQNQPEVEAATEECEDPIETTPEPVAAPTEAECVDEPITTEAAPETEPAAEECVEETTEAPAETADECAEEGNEVAPALNMRIEAAQDYGDIKIYEGESFVPEIEECEE